MSECTNWGLPCPACVERDSWLAFPDEPEAEAVPAVPAPTYRDEHPVARHGPRWQQQHGWGSGSVRQ